MDDEKAYVGVRRPSWRDGPVRDKQTTGGGGEGDLWDSSKVIADVIFETNSRSDRPGYGYQLKMGATSLTEAWNSERR